ncbi:DUF4956 domain-containing protein [Nitrospirota bacterium]
MDRIQTFTEFLSSQQVAIPFWSSMYNLILTSLLSFILAQVYIKFGTALSNRKMFAKNFMLIAMTTMLIITIVKSSLALSLGLVGALSIVRFRAAIKEPEELAYLFLTIAIGLGMGANQEILTIGAFIIICLILIMKNYSSATRNDSNLFLTISNNTPNKTDIDKTVETVNSFAVSSKLVRLEESPEKSEVSFIVEFDDFQNLSQCKNRIQELNKSLKVVFFDNKNIY